MWHADKTGKEETAALKAGASSATSGTFHSGGMSLSASFSQWKDGKQAAAYARQLSKNENPGKKPLTDGVINSGGGHYWYYEYDGSGKKGVVYWYSGVFTGKLVGEPGLVQGFFGQFPR